MARAAEELAKPPVPRRASDPANKKWSTAANSQHHIESTHQRTPPLHQRRCPIFFIQLCKITSCWSRSNRYAHPAVGCTWNKWATKSASAEKPPRSVLFSNKTTFGNHEKIGIVQHSDWSISFLTFSIWLFSTSIHFSTTEMMHLYLRYNNQVIFDLSLKALEKISIWVLYFCQVGAHYILVIEKNLVLKLQICTLYLFMATAVRQVPEIIFDIQFWP
jgi:hypothetical protein